MKRKHTKSNITLFLVIGLVIANIIGKFAQDSTLNKIYIISAIGIDKSRSGYVTSLQIYNPASNSKEGAAEQGAYTYSVEGRTISEAINRIQNRMPRAIFLDSMKVAVIGESLVKSEGISTLTQYFLRESSFPSNIRLVISKGVNPDKLLQIVTPVQKISGSRFDEMLDLKQDSWGELSNITADKIVGVLKQNRTELTIPYITLKGPFSKGISKSNIEKATPDTILEMDGFAVFKNQRLSYWLSSSESSLYALTRTNIHDTALVTKCSKQSGYVTWKDVQSKHDIQLQSGKGIPSFLLQVQIKGKLEDVSCNMDTSTVQNIDRLEHDAEQALQNQINRLIEKTQNKKTDINGFAETMYRKQPERWNRLKNNWDSVYSTIPIHTKVRIDILETGEISSQ
ncbi:Ger(x)C family spore germination protein [Neobacillus cucumis]|uniref:Ger(x)C family spore germination protein n=1 Tax=Neobacillus cucumis TaxID=1740721 RepID=UPI0018DF2B6C|nr:Ger(x)C family spore germination protein [Neobacillus cucumis]MBI0575860.1 Ger(x)C family spore germination protein [Neobacillus cucumis]